ncbi:peptidoglycan-binding domain-containing protein [Streptomyces sp. NPDC001833]|uniref:peptidoglycan-binding domain-containing protein n=1 Tax=Streptomyces sp. NPDC001833 TaxID=3154658 RepID=UPI003329A8D6
MIAAGASIAVHRRRDRVREIQCLLQYEWGISPGPIDGIFGSATEQAVEEFQGKCPLPADGIVGPLTWRCLRAGGPS